MVDVTLKGTDIEIVAYVTGAGHVVIRINRGGICVADIGIANATAEFTPDQLMAIGALTPPVLRDLKDVTELLKEISQVPA